MKFLKVGRVAIITRGRYAGKKVRIISSHDELFPVSIGFPRGACAGIRP